MTAVMPWAGATGEDEPVDAEVVEEAVSLTKKGVTVEATTNAVEKYAPDEDDYEIEEMDEGPPSKARGLALAVARPLPSPYQAVASVRWWVRTISQVLPWLPIMVVKELVPILRGLGRVIVRWAAWVQCAELAEAVKEAKENERSKATERLTKRKSARTWGSLVTLLTFSGLGTWLYFAVPLGFWGAVLVLVAVFDAVGRAGRGNADNPLPLAKTPPLGDPAVSLSQLTRTILETFEREGFEEGSVQAASFLSWDQTKREYRIRIKTADQIKPDHVRAIERAIGAKDHAIRNLATDTASVRELVVRVGDPLAMPVERPWIPTGTRSIAQPVLLGESMTDVPFAIPFAGVHIRIVAGTGGGKTKWILRSIIDGLSACQDVVLGGIDITNGPEMTLWRGVIQYKGLNVEDAEKVLDFALAEIDRRAKILTAIAEDDDPTNDADEWHPGLGPALVILVDEFSQLAAFDGKKTTINPNGINLLGKCEQVVRTGRKHWVSLVMETQKTGNDDFGSSTMSTQCGVTIAGPCAPTDAVTMFGIERRDAGFTPHLLAPGVEGDSRDAGKVFIESPMHRTPDIYRAFSPGSNSEVKRRAMRRIEDGLPTLNGRRHESVDAVEVPAILAAVERAFAGEGDPSRIATADLIAILRDAGHEFPEDAKVAAARLAEQLRPTGLTTRGDKDRWRPTPSSNPVRGYYLEDVRAAIRRLS